LQSNTLLPRRFRSSACLRTPAVRVGLPTSHVGTKAMHAARGAGQAFGQFQYLTSPEHTLAETHEAEFLRYRKLTADGRELQIAARDLYDMLQLDQRTDRILPNGWCLLPPRQSCDRGNACLTCDKFATDATFLPELRAQKDRTLALIDSRQAAFTARTGAPMTPGNVWLEGRQREAAALDAIITTLDAMPETAAHGQPDAIRGAGVPARADAAIARQEGRHGR
jgi:hypothetical protein